MGETRPTLQYVYYRPQLQLGFIIITVVFPINVSLLNNLPFYMYLPSVDFVGFNRGHWFRLN